MTKNASAARRPVLVITRQIPEAVQSRAEASYTIRQLALQGEFMPAALLPHVAGAAAILCTPADQFDAGLIDELPACLNVIATYSVGTEHLDVTAAAARGIVICNTPEVLSVATAELALTLLLMAARRAGEAERLLRAGRWRGLMPTFHLGTGVAGKALGIFGMGHIGRELAAMARGLQMTIHYHNRTRLPPALEAGAIYHSEDASFLAAIDFLSINAPGGPATYHWLNAKRLAALRRGAVVVNTGRGTSIDDAALIAALGTGHIAAAGLDVFEGEPNINPGYLALENIVLLPHIGSATVETREAMGFLALDGIGKALRLHNEPCR